jgi:predicted choloylglycine hydrolase
MALASTYACTIFVIKDAQRVLFCNNEDFSNPRTKIWFVPGGEGRLGCVCVGFNNGWAQGGMNTEGLAFDWVAGYKEKWEADPKLQPVKGNPAQRMLERCRSVQEAIAFFQTHWEPSFSYAKILIGDRTGKSVVIGAKDGHMSIDKKTEAQALGYRGQLVEEMFRENSEPTLTNAARILQGALQEGQYATKYSNVFDLKSGDIYIYRFPDQTEPCKLSLAEELKKGRHYYDIPELKDQLSERSARPAQ